MTNIRPNQSKPVKAQEELTTQRNDWFALGEEEVKLNKVAGN